MNRIHFPSFSFSVPAILKQTYDVVTTKGSDIAISLFSSLRENYGSHISSFSKPVLSDRAYYVLARIGDKYVACNAALVKWTMDCRFVRQHLILIVGAVVIVFYKIIRFFQEKAQFEREKQLAVDKDIAQAIRSIQHELSLFSPSDYEETELSSLAYWIRCVDRIITEANTKVDYLPVVPPSFETATKIAQGVRIINAIWERSLKPYLELTGAQIQLILRKLECLNIPKEQDKTAISSQVTRWSLEEIDQFLNSIESKMVAYSIAEAAKKEEISREISAVIYLWKNTIKPRLEKVLNKGEESVVAVPDEV